MHALRIFGLGLLASIGCDASPPPQHIQAWVNGWGEMGMYLPKQDQIDFLHANLDDVTPELEAAVSHTNPDIRQRAAFVIAEIGTDARALGGKVFEQLKVEPQQLVQIYLIDALGAVRYKEKEVVEFLETKYAALSDENTPPKLFGGDGTYAEVDEKVNLAGVLYVLSEPDSQEKYLGFVLEWLPPPSPDLGYREKSGYWERRWMAVNSLEKMQGANEAIPLLDAMLAEDDAKSWVRVHVPRVLKALRSARDGGVAAK
jgi:HEAT repeat protein